MVGKYHAGKQTWIVTHPISLWKKFRIISVYFRCFGVFQYIPVEIQDSAGMKVVLKKKKKLFLKPKQICILYTEKHQKEKKNEMKWNEKRYLNNKL